MKKILCYFLIIILSGVIFVLSFNYSSSNSPKAYYNVYLDDIDSLLEKIEIVDESLTISIADNYHGQIPISCVKLSKQVDTDKIKEELLSNLKNSSLPYYSIPKDIIIVNDIPKSIYGKKSRYLLKQIISKTNDQKVKTYGK